MRAGQAAARPGRRFDALRVKWDRMWGAFRLPSYRRAIVSICANHRMNPAPVDPATGDVILSRKPDSWDGFFKRLQSAEVPEDFLVDRGDAPPQARELF